MFRSIYVLYLLIGLLGLSSAALTRSVNERPFWNDLNRTSASPQIKRCSTNAECLRTGQSLIRPHRRSAIRALAPRQSAGFPRTFTAIQVTSDSGQEYGWVANFAGPALTFSNNTNAADPFTFTISSAERPSGFPYIAALMSVPADGTEYDLESGSVSYATLTAGSIDHPSGPAYTGPSDTYYDSENEEPGNSAGTETTLWVVDPDTLEITAQWVNSDGTAVPVAIVSYLRNNLLVLSGDGPELKSSFGQYGEIMTLKFATLPSPP
ncbi:hypothetical protein I204_01972 [Kwoniella mangroviensis CBS 8886]|uniref:uncharacterized protein n=1 Tax=Kwoniella mangroviensis CBS 8507 TaxID=1296122 RepID=UPI00080D6F07|nr:uncharacterized protein I203_03722 [Kwoniella mangroviensis CBS 8507]OCF67039.1 hypothetical protein I203_03722 [Kwoniella mangroviensis CBS 8507]OCF77967.1 hypothetical protein I204_01972 [Kwoniella mangroviensis CBS 8886]